VPPRSAFLSALSNTYYREEHNKRIKYLNDLELKLPDYDYPYPLYSDSEESHFFKIRLKKYLKKCDAKISKILTVLYEQEDETKDLVNNMSMLKNQQNPKLFKRLKEDYARNLTFLRELRTVTFEVVEALYERKKYIRQKLLENMLFLKQEATRRVYGNMMNL
jgi:glycyl-tRNA synthetase beta subunit